MSDKQKLEAITAKLLGDLYVGQRVKHKYSESKGVVLYVGRGKTMVGFNYETDGATVDWDDVGPIFYPADALEPA